MTQENFKSEFLSEKEIRRYSLQINHSEFGIKGQEKLKDSKVIVIGAGGKGTSVMQNLATIGIGKIGISDNYPVGENELSRQYLYGNGDLGKQKAIISKQKLLEINHYIKYELHNVCLSESNIINICKGYDVLIDATDNFPARYLINDAAIKLGKPLVFGNLDDNTGMVSVFNYKDGPSFRCLYPNSPADGERQRHHSFACQVSLMSIIGSIMANETLKIILGYETQLSGSLLKFDLTNYSFEFQSIKKDPDNFKSTGLSF